MADEQDPIEPTRFTIERLLQLRDHPAWIVVGDVPYADLQWESASDALQLYLDHRPAHKPIGGTYRVVHPAHGAIFVEMYEVKERRTFDIERVRLAAREVPAEVAE